MNKGMVAAVIGATAAAGLSGVALAHGGKRSNRAAGASQARRLPPPPPLPAASHFVRTIDNPWFPLEPGTVLTYKGQDEGTRARDVLRVTHRTERIQGIRATVVLDRVFEKGRVVERTHDYYAQDREGNVWYLGEDTATLRPDGTVESREGTFRAGRDGARGGIFMPAHPKRGDRGWQEYYVGHAQDRFRILNRHTRVRTPAVHSSHAMLVRETTPLEPGVVDHKIYVRGIGTVSERTVRGGNERYRLVSVRRRPALPKGDDPVSLVPAEFSANIDNAQWPMTVGSRWVYRVTDMSDGSSKREVITVTRRTKRMADGVRARVVRDIVRDHGKPVEVTSDWYAQDRDGNVWYFGEHTTAYNGRGKPTDNGTWQAGVHGAMPGIALPAKPCVGLSYREEYSKGVAEDQSRVLALDAQAQVRAGHFRHALLTEDFSPIEPDVSELKFYAKGSGQAVLAIDVSGGTDREELIRYTH